MKKPIAAQRTSATSRPAQISCGLEIEDGLCSRTGRFFILCPLFRRYSLAGRMRILLINLSLVLPDREIIHPSHSLARLWTELGHTVTLIASQSPAEKSQTIIDATDTGVRCLLIQTPFQPKTEAVTDLKLVLDFLTCRRRLSTAQCALRSEPPFDVVLAASNNQADNYTAFRLHRKTGAAFIRQTDLLLGSTLRDLAESSKTNPPILLLAFLRRAETLAYRHAAMVITSLPNSFDHMHDLGLDRERWLHLSQTSADLGALAPLYLRLFNECQRPSPAGK